MKRKAAIRTWKKTDKTSSLVSQDIAQPPVPTTLLGDLRSLIESARIRVAVGVNAEMVMLYWDIGSRIQRDILGQERAAYGKSIVATVSQQLT